VVARRLRLRLRPRAAPAAGRVHGRRAADEERLARASPGASALFLLLIPLFGLLANPTFSGLVLSFQGPRSSMTLFWLAGLVATLVYLVDVRPRSPACSGGPALVTGWSVLGTLSPEPALAAPDLLARPVAAGAQGPRTRGRRRVGVAEIDPALADTAAFCAAYGSPMDGSANCVVVAGRRGEAVRYAACLVLATTRADVNGLVRRRLDARKASFAPMDDAVALTGMEYGGITPLGLPDGWPLLVDAAVAAAPAVVVGSGLRASEAGAAGALLAALPGAEVVEGLARRAAREARSALPRTCSDTRFALS
jgi:prolyl-tRNA editing enzyme YbaK/EbsC (Cys-tRNA(Pro) deacylase)